MCRLPGAWSQDCRGIGQCPVRSFRIGREKTRAFAADLEHNQSGFPSDAVGDTSELPVNGVVEFQGIVPKLLISEGNPFDPPHDKFECWQEDWSSNKEEQISIAAGFHVQQAWVVSGPTKSD